MLSLADLSALIVPGIGDSGPRHWQTIWQTQHPQWRRVQQRDWAHPRCDEWVQALDSAIATMPAPPVLIAHSIGCLVAAEWMSRSAVPVQAVFLVAVPDPHGPGFPATAQGFNHLPPGPLRVPSLVVASHDDAFGSVVHARRCAAAWGSDIVDIGLAGHINADSGHGEWTEGLLLLQAWLTRTVPAPR